MRKYALLVAAAGLGLAGSMAKADFVITTTSAPIATGQFAGDVAYTFSIVNNGLNGSGTKFAGGDLWLESYQGSIPSVTFGQHNPAANGQLFIKAYDNEGSGNIDDAALSNETNTPAPGNGSFIRFGFVATTGGGPAWQIFSTTPPENSPDDVGVAANNPTPFTDGQALPGSFEVVGGSNIANNGTADTTPKILAIAVVPAGDVARLVGTAGSEVTPSPVAVDSVPEPASFSLLGLGLGALALRRRRA